MSVHAVDRQTVWIAVAARQDENACFGVHNTHAEMSDPKDRM